jgi:hypothetical protein
VIATYRHRHDVQDRDNPLGRQPRGVAARAERSAHSDGLRTRSASLDELATVASSAAYSSQGCSKLVNTGW